MGWATAANLMVRAGKGPRIVVGCDSGAEHTLPLPTHTPPLTPYIHTYPPHTTTPRRHDGRRAS